MVSSHELEKPTTGIRIIPAKALKIAIFGISPTFCLGIKIFAKPAESAPSPALDVKSPSPIAPLLNIPSAMTGRISNVPRMRHAKRAVIKSARLMNEFPET